MPDRVVTTAAGAPPSHAADQGSPTTPAADVLLQRVVVVAGDRGTDLVASLNAAGIAARAVPAASIATLIAGLVVLEDGPDTAAVAEVLTTLRRRGHAVAGVLLSDAAPSEQSQHLGAAADVILPAAAPVALVAAQLRALARLLAVEPPSSEPELITVRGITVDLERREVRAGGRALNLTPTEFRILSLLARKRGVVSHNELFREIHGYDVSDQEAKDILKVHIWRLRAKLAEAVPEANPIVNVRGFGYLLERRSRDRRAREEKG